MATIPNQGTGLRHVRKTINFDGSANNGNFGDAVSVFTITGAVIPVLFSLHCTDDLVGANLAGTYAALGTSNEEQSLTSQFVLDGAVAGKFPNSAGDGWGEVQGLPFVFAAGDPGKASGAVASNIALMVGTIGGGDDVTDGTLVIDFWYYPVTDGGALAGDDIDTELIAAANAQVVDALATDTYAEPDSVPAATSSLKDKINWLFALARNKVTQTSTTQTLRNDADSGNIATSSVSDDGSTFTRGEWS